MSVPAISFEAVIEGLQQWRRDKMALTVLVGLMGGDSVTEAWVRLDEALPVMKNLSDHSRPRAKDRIDIDHDMARRIYDIALDLEPWLRQIAEAEETVR